MGGSPRGWQGGAEPPAAAEGRYRIDPAYAEELWGTLQDMHPLVKMVPVKTESGVSGLKLFTGNGDDAFHERSRAVLASLGLRAGDVVVAIDGIAVNALPSSALEKPWAKRGKSVVRLSRDGTMVERTYLFATP